MAVQIKVPIELPYALSIFALLFAESITTNWMMYRTCYTTLGFNETDCALLGSGDTKNNTMELENKVQPYVTVIITIKSVTQVIAAFVCFFLGPWSDKYGRKPALLLSFAGFGLSYAIMAVISAMPNLSPWYMFLCTMPTSLNGGFAAQLTIILCYITDTSTLTNRGVRMAILEAALAGGALTGTLLSSFALNSYGYTIMYVIAACCYVLCCLVIHLFVPESVKDIETNNKFKSFFDLSLLRKSFTATFKERSDHKRAILLIAEAILILYVVAFTETNYTFLYLRRIFNWSLRQFTIFNGGSTITAIVGSFLLISIFHTRFKIKESITVLLGLLSCSSSALIVAFATNNGHIYVSGGVKFLAGTISPMTRSIISKVALEDTGAVFGFIAVCETLLGLIGKFVYTFIYNTMLPAALYYVTAGCYLISIILDIGLLLIEKRKVTGANYQILQNETE